MNLKWFSAENGILAGRPGTKSDAGQRPSFEAWVPFAASRPLTKEAHMQIPLEYFEQSMVQRGVDHFSHAHGAASHATAVKRKSDR